MAQPLAPNLELQQPDVLGQHAQLVRGTPVLAVPPESRAPYYIGLFAFLGAVTFGTVNAMRRRPLSYEPWWLVINMVGGGYIGYHVAQKYDATNGFLAQQFGAYTKMPTWAYGQLTSEELDSELRSARIAEFRAAYGRLTEIEEAEYLESRRTRQQLE